MSVVKIQGFGSYRSYLGKVFAHRFGRGTEVVAEGTRGAGLASALAEELARNMRCVCERELPVSPQATLWITRFGIHNAVEAVLSKPLRRQGRRNSGEKCIRTTHWADYANDQIGVLLAVGRQAWETQSWSGQHQALPGLG